MDLKQALSVHSEEVYLTIDQFFAQREEQAASIDEIIGQSAKILHTFTLRGGKNLRSFIARLSYQLSGGQENRKLLKALASIELHHRQLLILDDIFDADEQRYGGPTVEYTYRDLLKKHGDVDHMAQSMAMMDGVLLGSYSKEILLDSEFPAETILACLRLYDNQMYEQTLAGLQIHAYQCLEPIEDSTPERFIKGLELVTARYTFEAPLRIGLLLAESKDSSLQTKLDTYARFVGTAFQIRDDELGLFGDANLTGKPVGNDVREGKKTLLIQEAYRRADAKQQTQLAHAVGNKHLTKDEIAKVQEIVQSTGAFEYSHAMALRYVEQGIQALEDIPTSEALEQLISLAHYIVEREK